MRLAQLSLYYPYTYHYLLYHHYYHCHYHKSYSFFFMSVKNSLAVSYSNNSAFKSSNIFSFQTSTDSPCTYDNIHCIYSSTIASLIFILIYNLHAITKIKTFDKVPSNTCDLAISLLVLSFTPLYWRA